ncbi:hypothetical protein H6X68_05040 [Actinomyces sp. 186855]|nr:hypothetical protein [Actinomyces sp. AC-20-1]MCL3789760.1 hypothetical protein [Actinomyces sp. 187325]MCL3791955.1 hypothetical protein [Actinomyces sp. 186855]MCL3794617.1 hypothetical protein [Actinomyces sp. 217892]
MGIVGAVLVALSLAAGALSGGPAWSGALWGAGAGAALTAITVLALWFPWERHPLLASSGVMLSFAGKVAVMVVVVLLLGPHRESIDPVWFFVPLAAVLLTVTGVEIVTLAAGRTLTVEPVARPED